MVYLSKKDVQIIIKELPNTSNEEMKRILQKLRSQKNLIYVRTEREIKKLLQKAFNEKRRVKIKYYSPHSDENTNRIIDVYQLHKDCIIAFCNLREDKRTFVIDRINSDAILDEIYSIPKGWAPESIILDK